MNEIAKASKRQKEHSNLDSLDWEPGVRPTTLPRPTRPSSVVSRLNILYKNQRHQLPNKAKAPHRALVAPTILYGYERWPLNAEIILFISYIEHKPNESVRRQLDSLARNQEPMLSTVKRCKLSWFGHVTRHNTISKTTLEGRRRQAGRMKTWLENIDEWT